MSTSLVSKPFEWPLRVYIEDTDTGGIVYKKTARLDDALVAAARIVEAGKTYIVMVQEVYKIVARVNNGNGSESRELLCRSEVKLACVKQRSIKLHRIPELMLAAINREIR